MCRQWARRLGSEDLDRITPDQARHFLQRNRLRKQSGRSQEDGQMVLGFECLMRFFLLLRRKMMKCAGRSYLRELPFRRKSVQVIIRLQTKIKINRVTTYNSSVSCAI
jgi:hypothetical protein